MKTTTIISIICISAIIFGSCRARTSVENQAEISEITEQQEVDVVEFDYVGRLLSLLIKDLDNDGIMDTIRIKNFIHPRYVSAYMYENMALFDHFYISDTVSVNHSRIICRLSSRGFEKIQSQVVMADFMQIASPAVIEWGLAETETGFIFFDTFARGGFFVTSSHFRYNPTTENIQLISISRLVEGGRFGEGRSSVNLLTGEYIGNWYYYPLDSDMETLVKIPTIRVKMDFGEIYLENFGAETHSHFVEKCERLQRESIMSNIR